MQTVILSLLGVFALAVLFYFYNKKWKWRDIKVADPKEFRKGILFTHFNSVRPDDYYNTKDHTNAFWFANFFDFEEFLKILVATDKKIILDVSHWVADRKEDRMFYFKPDAEVVLRGIFARMHEMGVLDKIKYITIIDEPQLNCINKEAYQNMLLAAKKVAAEFDELDTAKWLVVYLNFADFWFIDQHDVLGTNCYKQNSAILTKGEHARLVRAKAPHQTTLLIPGEAYGQDPKPWVNWAHNNDDVELVVPFLWFANEAHGTDGSNKKSKTLGLEMADPAFRQKWIDAAHKITQT